MNTKSNEFGIGDNTTVNDAVLCYTQCFDHATCLTLVKKN